MLRSRDSGPDTVSTVASGTRTLSVRTRPGARLDYEVLTHYVLTTALAHPRSRSEQSFCRGSNRSHVT